MTKLKRKKKEVDAYQQFKREMAWQKVWSITKKVLFWAGLVLFFLIYAMIYFAKICINDK